MLNSRVEQNARTIETGATEACRVEFRGGYHIRVSEGGIHVCASIAIPALHPVEVDGEAPVPLRFERSGLERAERATRVPALIDLTMYPDNVSGILKRIISKLIESDGLKIRAGLRRCGSHGQ